jgi:dihydropyrimidinase
VAPTATNHARLYGLYRCKGSIAIGADGDIALWDPERRVTRRQVLTHHGSDCTPYEGLEVTGWPVTTIVRGRVVFDGGRVTAEAGHGRFLPQGASGGL